MSLQEQMWPYVLFLPESIDSRREFIRRVLASKVAPAVLSEFDESGRVLQKDLVQKLAHSNRSILSYLKALREFGLISTTSEVEMGKRIVVHELTRRGWGLARFFSKGLPSDFNELTEYLLEDYLLNLINLYREEGLETSALFEIFSRTRARTMLQSSEKQTNPEFLLLAASAFFTKIECSQFPDSGDEVGCKAPIRYPDGPTVRLALALADEGQTVAFVSSVGNDQDGWNLISELIQRGVESSHIKIEKELSTNQTIIVKANGDERTLVGIGELSALSITSPDQVPWDTLKKSKAIYLGEVFLEVAVSVAAFAQAAGIPVVYRCSPHYWRRGLQDLVPVLSHVDVLVLSDKEWKEAAHALGDPPISGLRQVTNALIIAKTDKKTYRVSNRGASEPVEYSCEYETDDLSVSFMVGLLGAALDDPTSSEIFDIALKHERSTLMKT